MKSAVLRRGGCAACGRRIDPDWSNSGFGVVCRPCHNDDVKLFSPENFDFEPVASRTPTGDDYEFEGTRVMINDRVGTLSWVYGDSSTITFDGDDRGSSVKLGYWELKHLYQASLAAA